MAAKKFLGKHLTASDRTLIHEGILEGASKTEIASRIGADPTTIAKEIKLHRILMPRHIHLVMKNCVNYKTCRQRKYCKKSCKDYEPFIPPSQIVVYYQGAIKSLFNCARTNAFLSISKNIL